MKNLFSLKFKDKNKLSIDFSDAKQLLEFIDAEDKFWSWISLDPSYQNTGYWQYCQNQHPLNHLKNILANLSNRSSEEINQNEVAEIEQLLNLRYLPNSQNNSYPLSSEPISQYISKIAETNPEKALNALQYVIAPYSLNQFPIMLGVAIEIELFKLGIKETAEQSSQAIIKLSNNLTNKVENLNSEIIDLQKSKNTFIDIATKDKESLLYEIRQECKETLTKLKNDHDNIRKAYKEDISLKEPVQYWDTKSTSHKKCFIGWTVISLIVLTAFIILMKELVFETLNLDEILKSSNADIKHWQAGLLLLSVFLGVWALRITIKIMLSHFHLGLDSKERVTMVKTYLSLMSEGKSLDGKDKELMLTALFRSSNTGIVKDDPIPPSWLAMLSSTSNKQI